MNGGMGALSGMMALVFVLLAMAIGIFLLVFWIKMIVDCATKEPSEGNDKVVWIVIIVLTGWVGALIYYLARRPQRIARYGR